MLHESFSGTMITCPQIYQFWKLGVNFGYFLLILSSMIDLVAKNQPIAVFKTIVSSSLNPQNSLQNPIKSLL
jgi:hypothetical protein